MRGLKVTTLALLAALSLPAGCSTLSSQKPDSIVVAYSPFENMALFWIAEDRGFFVRNGLRVSSRKYDTGAGSLDGMLKGEGDVTVGVTEFPTARRVLERRKARIVASIAKVEQIYLVANKNRGIGKIADLKGKRVGTTLGTVAHFYLGRLLELNEMSVEDVTVVDVKTPAGWVNAVADGDIDAIVTAQPYADAAKRRLGAKGAIWQAQAGQPIFGLVVSTDEWTTKQPEPARKLLAALAEAEEYAIRNPARSKAIVGKRLNVSAAYIEAVWSRDQFQLSLDQSLVVAMEDEARWMIRNGIASEKSIPDFTGGIYTDALEAVKPEAVNIIR
ncbi:MAG: hypothetical protein C4521_04330 [Actinobacteria bacterium]|nr:MAG: hypothetical protein C4521_04330 [Actinomycetota bacterium]